MIKAIFSSINAIRRADIGAVAWCLLWAVVFLQVFVRPYAVNWRGRFEAFGVPAVGWPGSDARNIQMAAHCKRLGMEFTGENACVAAATLVRGPYPDYPNAWVVPYNYPRIWMDLYGVFGSDSEGFFRAFWSVDALLLLIAVAGLALRINRAFLPVVLLSPICLFCVERGNVEAAVFFVAVLPFIFRWPPAVESFCLGVATALKLFPVVGFLSQLTDFSKARLVQVATGLALAAPLILYSAYSLGDTLKYTPHGFDFAYGVGILTYAPHFNEALRYPVIIGYVEFCTGMLAFLSLTPACRADAMGIVRSIREDERRLLILSLTIFVCTCLLFNNWAYRLLFLIPALLILSTVASPIARIMVGIIVCIFWIAIFPGAGQAINYVCLLLLPFAAFVLATALFAVQVEWPDRLLEAFASRHATEAPIR